MTEQKLKEGKQNGSNRREKNFKDFLETEAVQQALSIVGQSKQLVCDECDWADLGGEMYQCRKCYKIKDNLAN